MTPLIRSTMPPDRVESFGDDTPLGRAGAAGEVAPAYVLLASDEGSYMSGANIPVTGASRSCDRHPVRSAAISPKTCT